MPSTPNTLCYCANVQTVDVERYLRLHPQATLDELGRQLGCGITCGSCVPKLCEQLGKNAWFPADITTKPLTQLDAANLDRAIFLVELRLQQESNYPEVQIGQHVVIRLTTMSSAIIERTYTVVAHDKATQTLQIAVRLNAAGQMTPELLLAHAAQVQVSIPTGAGFELMQNRPIVFLAAGIGITPAVRLLSILDKGTPLVLDYSVDTVDDAVFTSMFDQHKAKHQHFDYFVRDRSTHGLIKYADVVRLVKGNPNAQFIVCGPAPYVTLVHSALQRTKVPEQQIHIEQFFIAAGTSPASMQRAQLKAPTMRLRAYLWTLVFLLVPLALLLVPSLESVRPHGHFNVGHNDLKCISCHQEAPGTMRQQLQTKTQNWLGMRDDSAAFGKLPVQNAVCIECHSNSADRHPAHRFLEPRFAVVRNDLAPQLCASCHREHSGTRLSITRSDFCMSCHTDLKIKQETIAPTHEVLIKNKRWDTCMQCHDFHGNHRYKTPTHLEDAFSLKQIAQYFETGKSPYGDPIIKGKKIPNETNDR